MSQTLPPLPTRTPKPAALPRPKLVAILRGLQLARAQAVGQLLFEAGFRCIEVPLNRPQALDCIAALCSVAPRDALIGGGTMLTPKQVDDVFSAGGRLMVAPNSDAAVIARAAALGMFCAPGVATPTEAFQALRAGAHALKLFPAEQIGVRGLKALCSVLPAETELWPVGGIGPSDLQAWHAAGATGFGIGSQLFQPHLDLPELAARAGDFLRAASKLPFGFGEAGLKPLPSSASGSAAQA